jgi:hypothetical protein
MLTRTAPTRWIVEGADEETGEEQVVTIEAADRLRAEAQARQTGLLVASIRPAPQPIAIDGPRIPWMPHGRDGQEMTLSTLAVVAPAVPAPANGNGNGHGNGNGNGHSHTHTHTKPAPVEGASLSYAAPRGAAASSVDLFHELAPEYRLLQITSIVLLVLAGLSYVVGVTTIWQLNSGFSFTSDNIGYGIRRFGETAGAIVVGALLQALAAGCLALRDMARNSFRRC